MGERGILGGDEGFPASQISISSFNAVEDPDQRL